MTVVWMVLIVSGSLVSLATFVWLLKIAFRESTLWGFACLFIPFAALIFVVKFWDHAKMPFFGCLAGSVLGVVAAVGYSMTSVNIGIDEYADLGEKVAWEAPNVESSPSVAFEDENSEPKGVSTQDQSVEVTDQVMKSAAELRISDYEESLKALDEVSEALPPRRPHRDGALVSISTLGLYQGERVVLTLKSLERVSAYVVSVDDHSVKLRHRVGGGSVIYTVDFDAIKEVRSRRDR